MACRGAIGNVCAWLLAAVLAAPAGGAGAAEPANAWVRLPERLEAPYVYSQPVYVPERKQVLIWGAVGGSDRPRNDVLALDPVAGQWVPDQASTPAAELARARDRGLGIGPKGGRGAILPDGRPAPAHVVNAACYDPARRQVVYVMNGLTAAYDPGARAWRDLGAKTVAWARLTRQEDQPHGMYERGLRPESLRAGDLLDGGPPVFGAGVCYDPVNDELLLFPHWGGQNTDLRGASGRISGHAGTFIYRFRDGRWRRVTPQLGGPAVRAARGGVMALMMLLDRALDAAWRAGRRSDALRGVTDRAIGVGGSALRGLEALLDGPLRVEPPPRCSAPMVYDPQLRAIVLFGGQDNRVRTDLHDLGRDPEPGALGDTWLYDVTRRRWHQVKAAGGAGPPAQRNPLLAYDEASGRVLLVTRTGQGRRGTIALWSFDGRTRAWSRRHEQAWEGGDDWAGMALDAGRRTLVLTQGAETWTFKLDLARLGAAPAPARSGDPPAAPPEALHRVPPDDPAWVARLRALPANRWVHARPPREADPRDWGIAACDAVRGHAYFFGGGHSTYQVNDVAVYAVGANRWAHAAGDHNDLVPPVRWDGQAMGYRGGPPAGHQRNSYVALDGRMYVFAGTSSRRWDAETARGPGTRLAWFYDLGRGGAWRQEAIARVELGEGVAGSYGRVHLADPQRGMIYGLAGHLEPYDGRFFEREAYLSAYDVVRNRLTVRRIPEPTPAWVGECRPFCLLPDRGRAGQIFYHEHRKGGGGPRTWVYDVAENRFTDLKPRRQPPGEPRTVEYVVDQGAVFAVIGRGETWVYSLARNAWAPLETTSDGPMGFAEPYAQVVYVARYGVLVNVGSASRGVAVMRPDLGGIRWEE